MFATEEIIEAFALPESTLVQQRVAKKLLVEHGANTAQDKKLIQSGVEAIHCIAMLKPMATGIPAWHSKQGEYLEIAFLRMTLRQDAKAQRLIHLLHRAIPYPVVLFTEVEGADALNMSFAHKRLSQIGELNYIIDGELLEVLMHSEHAVKVAQESVFVLHQQQVQNLHALYQAWMDHASSLLAAEITGEYQVIENAPQAAALREDLAQFHAKWNEVELLRSKVRKENQINKKAEMNLRIQALKYEIESHKERLRH